MPGIQVFIFLISENRDFPKCDEEPLCAGMAGK